jgi:hypothetical protein
MVRRTILGLSTIALLASVTAAFAEQKTLKDQIIGTWSITSIYDLFDSGKKFNPWGMGVKGSLTFVSGGRYTQMIIGEIEPAMKTPDTRRADAFAMAAVGTYTVNEAEKQITVRFERATNSIRNGAEQVWVATFSGDTLTLAATTPRTNAKDPQAKYLPHLELKRDK